MAIRCDKNSLISSYAFHDFNNGDRLVYNQKTDSLSFVKKGTRIDRDCTTNLKVISQRIAKLFEEIRLQSPPLRAHSLNSQQRIYFTANFEKLNPIIQKYNSLVKKNRCLNFLDYLLWIITFGKMQISCKNYEPLKDRLSVWDSGETLKAAIKDQQLEDFLINYKPDFYVGFLNHSFENLDEAIENRMYALAKHFGIEKLTQLDLGTKLNLTELALKHEAKHKEDEQNAKEDTRLSTALIKELSKDGQIVQNGDFFQILDELRTKYDPRLDVLLRDASGHFLSRLLRHLANANPPFLDLQLKIVCFIVGSRPDKNDFLGAIQSFFNKGLSDEGRASDLVGFIDEFRGNPHQYKVYETSSDIRLQLLKNQTIIRRPELFLEVLNLVIDNDISVDQPAPTQRTIDCCEAICNLGRIGEVWGGLTEARRIKLLSVTNKYKSLQNEHIFTLGAQVFKAAAEHYEKLSKEEKPHFFTSLKNNDASLMLNKSRKIFFDFVSHFAKSEPEEKEAKLRGQAQIEKNDFITSQILPKIRKVGDLKDEELIATIEVCSKIYFNVLNSSGSILRANVPYKAILVFMAKNIEHATQNSHFAIQLCAAQAFQSQEMESKFTRSDVLTVFKSIPAYQIPRDFFISMYLDTDQLKGNREYYGAWKKNAEANMKNETQRNLYDGYNQAELKRYTDLYTAFDMQLTPDGKPLFDTFRVFSDAIKRNPEMEPDIVLEKATEEQLEFFYRPLEADLEVDFSHLAREVAAKQAVPPLPPNSGVINYEELVKMFDQINFNKAARQEDYVDPRSLEDDGEPVSVAQLKDGIENFVNRCKNPGNYYGLPPDPDEKEKFLQDLDLYIKHIILILRKRPAKDRSLQLISMASAGIHCGNKFMSIAQDSYYQVTGAECTADGETLLGRIIYLLTAGRRGIFEERVRRITNGEVHARSAALKKVGKPFGLPEANAYQFRDQYTGHYFKDGEEGLKECNRLMRECCIDYTHTFIINMINSRFQTALPGCKPEIDAKFREGALEQWFVDRNPKFNGPNQLARQMAAKIRTLKNGKDFDARRDLNEKQKLKFKGEILKLREKISGKSIKDIKREREDDVKKKEAALRGKIEVKPPNNLPVQMQERVRNRMVEAERKAMEGRLKEAHGKLARARSMENPKIPLSADEMDEIGNEITNVIAGLRASALREVCSENLLFKRKWLVKLLVAHGILKIKTEFFGLKDKSGYWS